MGLAKPVLHNPDPVPFRLSPNLQLLMGPIVTEGIFAPALMALARCLMEPDGELELDLSVFVRDEVTFWYTSQRHAVPNAQALREHVATNTEHVIKRAKSLAQPPEVNGLPANQTVVDLVATAVNPKNLSTTDPLWMAWL
jgi:transformation/transcription domain-associated protein